MMSTTARVSHIERSPCGDVTFVTLTPEQPIDFAAGQFCMIEHTINGTLIKKPYSIATTPHQMHRDGTLGVIVKRASLNGMSNYLTRDICLSDHLTLRGPAGRMVDDRTRSRYLLISTGSGLGPIYSIYHDLLQHNAYDQIVHLFGEKKTTNLLPSILHSFATNPNDRVTQQITLSRQKSPDYRHGHVQSLLPQSLTTLTESGSIDDIAVYICGKPAMVDDVTAILTSTYGCTPAQIHSEKY